MNGIAIKDIPRALVPKDTCGFCGEKLILNKSSFEQYQPSVYRCDKCANEISIPQINRSEIMNIMQGEVKIGLNREKLVKLLKNIIPTDYPSDCEIFSDSIIANQKDLFEVIK